MSIGTRKKISNEELNRISVDEFKKSKKLPIIIALDNIRSLNNVGSVFRTSDAFRIEKVYLCGITPKPPHRDIQKTALGSTESVEWEYIVSVEKLIDNQLAIGNEVWSIEQVEGAILLNDFQPNTKNKLVLVFGNEVNGVSQEVVNKSTGCLEVPQFGTKHSINISVCTGVVIWDVYSKIGANLE